MSDRIYRVVKLYRPQIGTRYWLQRGHWYETAGAMGAATGRPKRAFAVDFEECYRTKAEAEAKRSYYEGREGERAVGPKPAAPA